MRFAHLILALSAAGLLSGCGTLNNNVAIFYYQRPADPPDDFQPPNYVYGGVRWGSRAIHEALSDPDVPLLTRVVAPLWLIDMPFSAVFDTLNLPHTIGATEKEATWWRDANLWQWGTH
jgi:uncharacterized protein YceK